MEFKITKITNDDLEEVLKIVKEFWGDHRIISQGQVFDTAKLAGFKAVDHNRIVGILHFEIRDNDCEILTLASLNNGQGIGSALLDELEASARKNKCHKLSLSTTNDNLHALGFYQRRGFYLKALLPGQMKGYRKLKPSIPETGDLGIPIRDEIRLEKRLV